jgi:F-type H+-transporting ATPase subunit delta
MKISKDAQRTARQLLRASLTEGHLNADLVRKITRTVVERKPRGYLQILTAYAKLLRLETERHHALVESAAELSPELRQSVEAELRKKRGANLTFAFVVNPDLLGGIRVKVGSDVWDGSVRSRLERLRLAFS